MKHGMANTPMYNRWSNMKGRCLNPKNSNYPNYGGRGIVVCDRWVNSFPNYLADVGYPPPGKWALGRIDNQKGYEPGNVRWETYTQNARNTRHNKFVTIDGKTRCVTEWLKDIGLTEGAYKYRIKAGWTTKKALSLAPFAMKREPTCTLNGTTLTFRQWAQKAGVHPRTFYQRRRAGWPIDRALTEPPMHGKSLAQRS